MVAECSLLLLVPAILRCLHMMNASPCIQRPMLLCNSAPFCFWLLCRGLTLLVSEACCSLEEARSAQAKHLEKLSVMEDLLDPVIVINEEGKILIFNRGAEELFGFEKVYQTKILFISCLYILDAIACLFYQRFVASSTWTKCFNVDACNVRSKA